MKRSQKEAIERRSAIMRAVKARNTGPELIVRRLAHAVSPGYRLHRRDIPGNPDIAYIGRRRVIFVHGCFWHGHDCTRGARKPKTNVAYWTWKIERNRERDRLARRALSLSGWRALVIWECELRREQAVSAKLAKFLSPLR